MPVTLSPIARFFSHLHPPSKASLNILPNDILVDVVFTYLSVRDILRMRRVSKLYYQLTHHPVIWKRLLRTSHLPIPPLPPTSRHSLENLTGLEAERLLTRAHSLDKIWRWSPPESGEGDLYERWEFDAQRHVAHMVLLPGSQYLVASVSDATRQDWALIIYVLDSRYNVIPIAKTDTRTKAYNLQAKYLTVNGVHGITISYVRRDWRRRAHGKRGINVSEYSADHEIDAPYPLKYECITFHVPLRTLEGLCDTRFVPGSRAFLEHAKAQIPPFQQICLIRSSRKLGTLSLDDFAGKPYLTLMRFPNDIMFKPLNGGPLSVLTVRPIPQFAANFHYIKAIRPLPQQQQILIVREVSVTFEQNAFPITALEMLNIPANRTGAYLHVEGNPVDSVYMYDDRFTDVYISEHGSPPWIDDSVQGTLLRSSEEEQETAHKPRPISVFFKTVLPSIGLLRISFYPQKTASATHAFPDVSLRLPLQHFWRYTLAYCSPVRFVECHEGAQYRILPGAHRTLLYTVPWDDLTDAPAVRAFFRYHDAELFADEPEDLFDENMEVNVMRRPVRKLPFNFPGERFACLAWDETVGRICFARPGTTRMVVLDFSKRPKEDFLGRRMPLPVQHEHDVAMYLD